MILQLFKARKVYRRRYAIIGHDIIMVKIAHAYNYIDKVWGLFNMKEPISVLM